MKQIAIRKKPVITKAQIVQALRGMGLKTGDNVIAHAALSSLGYVRGGADALLDALLAVVGEKGTLMMPAFGSEEPFDPTNTPSNLGTISETFRQRPGVLRSCHPLSSVVALGPRAKYYVKGHEKARCPLGQGSPYLKLADDGGYVLLVGVDQDRNTTLHVAEVLADAPYLMPWQASWINNRGKVVTKVFHRFAGPHRNFIAVDPMLRKAGICKTGRIGNAVVRLMKAREMIDFLTARIRENPSLFLSTSNDYWDGLWQRGRIRQASLQDQGLCVVLRSSTAGTNMEQVFWEAQGLGTQSLELDVVDGRDISQLDAQDLRYLQARLEKRDFRVETIRCNISGQKPFEAYLKAAAKLSANGIVVPLTGTPQSLSNKAAAAAKKGLTLYAENVAIAADDAAQLLTAAGQSIKLAFDPVGFALAGQKPFLQSFRNKTLKKRLGYLAIRDLTKDGSPQLPGRGKAELAELISILRCSSFAGPFVLAHSPGAGFACHQAATALCDLLADTAVD